MKSTATSRPSVATAMVATIHGYGVDTAFGIPGTHNLELYRALGEFGFHAVTTRHEQGAGYAADGWAQRTRRPGLVITTSGPGLLNVLSPMASAFCESRPMLVLSPGQDLGASGIRDGSLHETHNSVQAVAALIGRSERVNSGEEAVEAVHRAFSVFLKERPGPVHIEIPLDVLESTFEPDAETIVPRMPEREVAASIADLERAASLIAQAKKPAMLVGGGAVNAHREVRSLAEHAQIPVLTTVNGKGVLPESHPLSLGAEWRLPSARQILSDADLLIVVGSKLGVAERNGAVFAPSALTIRIDIDPQQIDTTIAPDVRLVGDAALVVAEICQRLPTFLEGATVEEWVARTRLELREEARAVAPSLAALNEAIAAALPSNTVVAGDSSQITYLAGSTFIPAESPTQFLFMPAFSTLGYGLPAAIGAKVASPDVPVVCVVGDGALMFALQELTTVVEQNLNIVVICIDNGGYGEIAQNMRDREMPLEGVDLLQPDWRKLAESFGFESSSSNDDSITEAVKAALLRNAPCFIHHRMPA